MNRAKKKEKKIGKNILHKRNTENMVQENVVIPTTSYRIEMSHRDRDRKE